MHKNMQNSAETEPRIETPAITPREMGILNLKLPEKDFILLFWHCFQYWVSPTQ